MSAAAEHVGDTALDCARAGTERTDGFVAREASTAQFATHGAVTAGVAAISPLADLVISSGTFRHDCLTMSRRGRCPSRCGDRTVFRVSGEPEMEVTRLLRGCAAEIPDDFTEVFVGYPTVHREPLVPGRVSTAARLAEPVTDGRVTDLGRSFRALFDNGVNAARLRGGDLVVVENLDQGALWFLAEEAATGESLAGWRLVHLPPCRKPP